VKVIFTPYILILLFLLDFSTSYGQKFQLVAKADNSINNTILEEISYLKNHSSKEGVFKELKTIKSKLEKKGYLNSTLDTLYLKDSIYTAHFILGKLTERLRIYYRDDSLHYHKIPQKLIEQISTQMTNDYFEIPFEQISNSLEHIVNYYEEDGKSFVQVTLKNIHLEAKNAIAQLNITDAKSRTIDKVIIKGYEDFPKSYIKYNLNLKPKSVFSNDKLISVSSALNNLPFVEEQKSPEVLFTNDSTYIYLYLKKKQSNRFDGVLGFSSKEEGSGLEFNGYLDFLFNNIFNRGESIKLLWKNNENNSQQFFISATVPYIFNLPIIPKASFEIFRQDSTYNNITTNFSIGFLLNPKSKITAAYNSENSNNLLNENSPDSNISSFKNNFFGGAFNYRLFNRDPLYPEKFTLNFSAFYGNRETKNTKTNQIKFLLSINYLFSINFKNHIFIQNQSGILNSEDYYINELFRIGGINSIRGINENSVLASAYSIFNLEYRFKPSNSSYLFTISDFALVKNPIVNDYSNIFSIGLGYAFITKLGILNLSYATAKFNNNSFNFSDAKVNIQLISVF